MTVVAEFALLLHVLVTGYWIEPMKYEIANGVMHLHLSAPAPLPSHGIHTVYMYAYHISFDSIKRPAADVPVEKDFP